MLRNKGEKMLRNNELFKKMKLIFAMVGLICLLVSSAFIMFGKSAHVAYAEETEAEYFRVKEGASIRKKSGVGIRFLAQASKSFVERISAIDSEAEYGILLIPTDMLSGELTVNTSKVKEGIRTKWETTGTEYTYYIALIGSESLSDYPSSEYNRAITAKAFVRYTENEIEKIEYSENSVSRTISYVASSARAKGESDPNNVINSIINTAFTAAGAEFDAESYFPSSFTILQGETLTPALEKEDGGLNYVVKFESDDTSVATVSSSGVITGVSAGSATITASIGSEHKVSFTVAVNGTTDGLVEDVLLDATHKYSGRLVDGVPETTGDETATLTYIAEGSTSTFVGKFSEGMPTTGRRTFERASGLMYVDTVVGAMTGFDTFDNTVRCSGYYSYSAGGNYVVGELKVDTNGGGCIFDGDGIMYYTDNSTYEGEFENGTFSGEGTFTWGDGSSVFSGTFVRGASTYGTYTKVGKTSSNYTGIISYTGQCTGSGIGVFETGESGTGVFSFGSGRSHNGIISLTSGNIWNNRCTFEYDYVWDVHSHFVGTFVDGVATRGRYITDKTSGLIWFEGEVEEAAVGSFIGTFKQNTNGKGYYYYDNGGTNDCWYKGGMYVHTTGNVWTCGSTFNSPDGDGEFYWNSSGWHLTKGVFVNGTNTYGRITCENANSGDQLKWFEGAMTGTADFVSGGSGTGLFVYSDGAKYEGEMTINNSNISNNSCTFSGTGTFTWDDYSTFTGTFVNGQATYGTYSRPLSTTGILYFTGTCVNTGTFATETAGIGKWVSDDGTETYEGTMYLRDGNIWANSWHK